MGQALYQNNLVLFHFSFLFLFWFGFPGITRHIELGHNFILFFCGARYQTQ